jgi:phosphoglucomutase
MMEQYRADPPESIDGIPVEQLLDYGSQAGKDLKSGKTWKIGLPVSNVLQFILSDGTKISARPSGTEPKIKFYFSVHAPLASASEFEKTEDRLNKKIARLEKEMESK